ncbi:hypothetical protein [Kitasatospora sp. HPMI-4]|uniref:hypothetical protein n=1 Tax=Kitasatospora sp. HPMI-4 TaxID=3448443 RepID=UPI003F1B8EB6
MNTSEPKTSHVNDHQREDHPMELSATGNPAVVREDTQIEVGIDLQRGTLALTHGGKAYEAYHARVKFAGVQQDPWQAEQVTFSVKGTNGKTSALVVEFFGEKWDDPAPKIPAAIWKVVALAASAAGDLGITYTAPAGA